MVEVKFRSLEIIEIFGANLILIRVFFLTWSSRVRRSKIEPFRLPSSRSFKFSIASPTASESLRVMSQMLLQ